MPLFPLFSVTQSNCNELIIRDITPPYSPNYMGGYGGVNYEADKIAKSTITLDFGNNQVYELGSDYNQTKPDWVIKADTITFNATPGSDCNDCGGLPCGCSDCDDTPKIEPDCLGKLSTFPSGCITIRYEVFTQLSPTSQFVSRGIKVIKIITSCHEETLFSEVADKITSDKYCNEYDFTSTRESRLNAMRDLMLAWTKLRILQEEKGCDCDCIAGRIKQINYLLKSMKF